MTDPTPRKITLGCDTGHGEAIAMLLAHSTEAAHIAFNRRWPLVTVGLDSTHQALATRQVFDGLAAVGARREGRTTSVVTELDHTRLGDRVWDALIRTGEGGR